MVWEPVNLAEKCPSDANFTACSPFGFFYLSLLAQLYGDSSDRRIQMHLEKKRLDDCKLIAEVEERLQKYVEKMDAEKDKSNEADERENKCFKNTITNEHDVLIKSPNIACANVRNHKCDAEKHVIHKINKKDDKIGQKTTNNKCRSDQDRFNDKKEYDFIVVGAGTAGCVVASRLTDDDFDVLLLEAGTEEPDVTEVPSTNTCLQGSNIDWQYYSQPNGKSCLAQPNQRCPLPAGRVMGGGSAINSLAYIRGNKLDYDSWAALGNIGWSYKDVLPFFIKSEDNLNMGNSNSKCYGVDGPQTISSYPYIDDPGNMMIEAYNESGIPITDYNCGEQVGTMQSLSFSRGGIRMSANTAFIRPKRYTRPNLTVKVESLATKILIDNGRAYGVEYINRGKTYQATARKEVIVSAGPLSSPKLLMLSGIGPSDHLKEAGIDVIKDLPVGYNLHDHVTFDGIIIILPNQTATTIDDVQIIKNIIEFKKMKIKQGPLSGIGPVNSIAFIKTDPDLAVPDIQFQSDRVEDWREYVQAPAAYKYLSILPSAYYNCIMIRAMQLGPESVGRLYLNVSDCVHAYPIIHMNYLGNPKDSDAFVKAVKFIYSLEHTKAFKDRGAYLYKEPLKPCDAYAWGTTDYILCMARSFTSSTYHAVGTCKMGPKEDGNTVVDYRLRVFDIEHLRVVDSSIMPTVPRGNTNAPTIMVGEKGAHMIAEDWGKGEHIGCNCN